MFGINNTRTGGCLVLAGAIASLAALFGGAASAASPSGPARATEYPLVVIGFVTTPKRPKAGKEFTAGAMIVNDETQSPASGRIRCPAKIRGNGVRVTFKAFDTGVAICEWKVPRGAGGRRFVGSMEVVVEDDYSGSTYTASIPVSKVIRR